MAVRFFSAEFQWNTRRSARIRVNEIVCNSTKSCVIGARSPAAAANRASSVIDAVIENRPGLIDR